MGQMAWGWILPRYPWQKRGHVTETGAIGIRPKEGIWQKFNMGQLPWARILPRYPWQKRGEKIFCRQMEKKFKFLNRNQLKNF